MSSEIITTTRKIKAFRPLMSKNTLGQRVSDAIKAYIVSENLKPGDMLPSERQWSEALAVSRNIVREGLSGLVAEGIIVKQPGKGIFLSQVDSDALHQDGSRVLEEEQARYLAVREARAAVEIGAIGLIVSRISEDDLADLEALTEALERKLASGEPFPREDMQFHIRLLRAARNDILLQWTPLVEDVMRGWAFQTGTAPWVSTPADWPGDVQRVAQEHRAILDAIRNRDVDAARQLLTQHFLLPDL